MTYKIVFDNGKPYEVIVKSEEDLIKELKSFYENHKDKGEFFDCRVYDINEEDISESQFISEIISDIINGEVLK